MRTPINLFNLTLETISNSRGSQQSCQIFYKVHHHALLQDVFILFVEQWSEQFCKSEYKDDVFTVIREKIWLKMVDSNYQLYQLLASAIQLHWKRISGVFKVNWNILWYWETQYTQNQDGKWQRRKMEIMYFAQNGIWLIAAAILNTLDRRYWKNVPVQSQNVSPVDAGAKQVALIVRTYAPARSVRRNLTIKLQMTRVLMNLRKTMILWTF